MAATVALAFGIRPLSAARRERLRRAAPAIGHLRQENNTVLQRLLYWINNHAWDAQDEDMGRRLVTKLPLLVIDGEWDHGSVDTGEQVMDENGQPDPEYEPKTISRLIRSLLHAFTRKAYIGYTATPFANIFILDQGETREHGPDLFPSAFIVSLSAPSNYIGRLRDECLNETLFVSLGHARSVLRLWRDDYNHVRPHSGVGGLTPADATRRVAQHRSEAHHTSPGLQL